MVYDPSTTFVRWFAYSRWPSSIAMRFQPHSYGPKYQVIVPEIPVESPCDKSPYNKGWYNIIYGMIALMVNLSIKLPDFQNHQLFNDENRIVADGHFQCSRPASQQPKDTGRPQSVLPKDVGPMFYGSSMLRMGSGSVRSMGSRRLRLWKLGTHS